MRKILLLLFFTAIVFILNAQNIARKQGNATRTEGGIKIDGIANESEWLKASIMSDLIQQEPEPSKPARLKTEARVLYDNRAIYIHAFMHDPFPDSIAKELTLRDDTDGNTDVFCVILDTYKDGNNGFYFCVLPTGVQADAKAYPAQGFDGNDSGEDYAWSAVWKSAVKINEKGWSVEMEIPYSAFRFPNDSLQTWRFNFGRHIKRYRETSFWNEVNPNVNGFINQCGELTGIKNIKSPFRLQAFPFVSAYGQNDFNKNGNPKSIWSKTFTGGMDVKYGINDAFTLDMTLIPDFGQVRSDNKILNLTPFEVRFDENRQFFTEGVELFNKGGFFYSRRVGSIPNYFYDELEKKATGGIISTPTEAQLYNATKVSGRMKNGLGIGVFNATAAPTYATVQNREGVIYQEKVTPLTNYNVVSFDKNLPHNSYFTLINTNVARSGKAYDANLTGIAFDIKDKKNVYSLAGNGAIAQQYYGDKTDLSHTYYTKLAKISGLWRWEAIHVLESHDYNPNDLGFLRNPNENSWIAWAGRFKYNTKRFNEWNINGYTYVSFLHRPRVYSDYQMNLEGFFLTKKILGFGYELKAEPIATHDYFEPRTADFSRYYRYPVNYRIGGFISTDYRKMVATDVRLYYRWFNERGQNNITVNFEPRIRFSDKISLIWSSQITKYNNFPNYVSKNADAVGFGQIPNTAIILGERKQWEIENTPNLKWSFNHLMGMNFRIRHYWSSVNYVRYFELGQKGELLNTPYKGIKADNGGTSLHNTNFNLFNIDANFTWRFAPGSDIIVNWKNNIFGENRDIARDYFYNVGNLFDNPVNNSVSVRVIYFLDYLNFVKSKK